MLEKGCAAQNIVCQYFVTATTMSIAKLKDSVNLD
jgi:hypothetical protein